jgi:hypothetical protein
MKRANTFLSLRVYIKCWLKIRETGVCASCAEYIIWHAPRISTSALINIKTLITPCMSARALHTMCVCCVSPSVCANTKVILNAAGEWHLQLSYIRRWLGCYYVRYQCERAYVCVRCWLLHARTHMKIYPRAHINSRGKGSLLLPLVRARKQKTFAAAFLITCVFECECARSLSCFIVIERAAVMRRTSQHPQSGNLIRPSSNKCCVRYICNFEFRRDRYSN